MKETESNLENFDFIAKESSLTFLAEQAFQRLSFTFTKEHLESIIKAALAPDTSKNDRYVLACILKNAEVSAKGTFPLCQDTGIANIFGWKKGNCPSKGNEYEQISEGVKKIYDEKKLRFSTTVPQSFYEEKDPKNNMPAQISLFSAGAALAPTPDFVKDAPADSISFVFCAKGGGSSNKTSFIQGTKAFLTKERFSKLMKEELEHFGTSACPPYTIAIVAGGLSPEQNLLTLKLASMGAYEKMTYQPKENGFRDRELEELAMAIAEKSGYGAQFGGTKFALSAIVIRLPRHGASCPISFGVSCSAHRNLKAILTKDGFYLEKTVSEPEKLPGFQEAVKYAAPNTNSLTQTEIRIESKGKMEDVLKALGEARPGDRVILSGKILVARDAAHARWQQLINENKALPDYCTSYPICYAGPART
ncbi:MAG: fumarate hydratase, partial [Treponema sp.]|nr:fumarate hydratase [Treponema sp.]